MPVELLSDLIDIADVKLVIELDDADKDPDGITSSFVFTGEIRQGADIILNRMSLDTGCGIFLKGNYGSGKSHFLSYLYLLLKNRLPFLEDYPGLKDRDFKVVKVSLVKYPSSRPLEDIVLAAFGHTAKVIDREKTFSEIIDRHTALIIDELSEFLRSKPSPSSFYEDIRFLQFLGEFSFHNPLWIIASLQEWIEETGHISSSIFNRIKDRYPLRINLTSSHIEDIIDRRIIVKKPGANEAIKKIFFELKKYYPHLSLKYDDFMKTYPLHPFTVRFLSGLTPVFSQHRGVIQFVFSEAGKMLDRAADELITPDAIFDHFEERIREIPEYSPFARVAYDYYKVRMDEILPRPQQQEAGIAAIKIMALAEISPIEKRKTARGIAEILLKKVSTLTSQINYEFIKDAVLEPLVAHRMYINKEGEEFFIDPGVDEGIRIKARIKAFRERFEDRGHLFSEICSLLNLDCLPLTDIRQGRKYRFVWQNSMRECTAMLSLPGRLKRGDIERMIEGVEKRIDGFFVILPPFPEDNRWIYSLKDTFSNPRLLSLVFWAPRGFSDEERQFVEEFISRCRLIKEFPPLGNEVKRDEGRFRDIMTSVYYEGKIVYGTGRELKNLKEIGYLPVEKLISHIFDYPLSETYPDHYKIMPRIEFFSSHHLNSLFTDFIKQGKITLQEAKKRGLLPYIKGLLEPMGIVKKRGGSLMVSLDVENSIVSHTLNTASREDNLEALKTSLKKGKWGMGEEQINILLSAFIVSGHLVPFGRDGIIELIDLPQLASGIVASLKTGRTISPELLSYIHHGSFIWGDVEDVPTPLTRKAMWKEATLLIRKERKVIAEVNEFLNRYRDYPLFKKMSVDNAILNRLSMFLNSLTLSFQPAEGIERMLAYLKENPGLKDEIDYLEKIHTFFAEHFQLITKYYLYLTHPSLRLPAAAENCDEMRQVLLSNIEEYLNSFNVEFSSLKDKWEEFFKAFTDAYRDGHGQYYGSPVFSVRDEIGKSGEGRALKRISEIVKSVTFEPDWWTLKNEIDRMPDVCREDLNYELFNAPVCRCNYRINDNPPEADNDLAAKCREGILGFLRVLQSPENREKLESYVLSAGDAGREDVAEKVSSVLNLDLSKANMSLILPLLTSNVLDEIHSAFKGRWKIREVRSKDFIDRVRGRRLRHSELSALFYQWAGRDDDTIIWIRDEDEPGTGLMKEELSRYGSDGERISDRIFGKDFRKAAYIIYGGMVSRGEKIRDMENRLKDEGRLSLFEEIRLSSYSTDDLFRLLDTEKIDYMKKRLRTELFHRLWGRIIGDEKIKSTSDETMKDVLRIILITSREGRYNGVELFTEVIAPLQLHVEKLRHGNIDGAKIDDDVIDRIKEKLDQLTNRYGKGIEGKEPVAGVEDIKNTIKGVAAIFDGLRYDLWVMLREELLKEGFTIHEKPFRISAPSSTARFRETMGIEENGNINGKSYTLYKWAERGIGRREMKKILNSGEDIIFLHFNFIDTKVHSSTLNLYPLFINIRAEFTSAIMPLLKDIGSFFVLSDHGFTDRNRMKDRYTHGAAGVWETILPFAEVRRGFKFERSGGD